MTLAAEYNVVASLVEQESWPQDNVKLWEISKVILSRLHFNNFKYVYFTQAKRC